MTTLRRVAVAAFVLLPVFARPVSGQEGCILGERGNDLVDSQVLPGLGRVTYITRPHFVCEGGVQIFADSAVAYGDRGMSHLIGRVRYVEESRELRAEEARYFSNEGRLQAERSVRVVDQAQGSSIENGDLIYLLQTDFRPEATITVTTGADGIRPTAVLTPPPDTIASDSAGVVSETPDSTAVAGTDPPPVPEADRPNRSIEPYTVVAHRIFLRGSGYFTASNDVEIVRDSLYAYADSAEYDETLGELALVGSASVIGSSYSLTGRTITMFDPGGDASEVRAVREARLVGEDVLLTSAQILVLLRDGGLHRLVATPITRPGGEVADSADLERPEAHVEEFVLTADSLEVDAPEERLQRVFASGTARSVSSARDSLNAEVLPELARKDWLEGDTVIIRFVGSPEVPPLGGAPVTTILVDSSFVSDSLPGLDTLAAIEPEAAPDSVAVEPPVEDATPEDPLAPIEEQDPAEVEEIVARVRARSLYRLVPNDTTFRAGVDAPAVHYVVGQEIRILLTDGEVRQMQVTGQTRGVHLEPLSRAPRADTAVVADTMIAVDTTVVVDTTAVIDTTGVVDTTTVGDTVGRTPGTSRPDRPYQRSEPDAKDGAVRPHEEHPWIRR